MYCFRSVSYQFYSVAGLCARLIFCIYFKCKCFYFSTVVTFTGFDGDILNGLRWMLYILSVFIDLIVSKKKLNAFGNFTLDIQIRCIKWMNKINLVVNLSMFKNLTLFKIMNNNEFKWIICRLFFFHWLNNDW